MLDAPARAVGDSGFSSSNNPFAQAPPAAAAIDELLRSVLEEMDHGVILIDAQRRVMYSNRLAQQELAGHSALCIIGGVLHAARSPQQAQLAQAARSAEIGCRSMIDLGETEQRLALAFVPLDRSAHAYGAATIMVVCGKRHTAENLALQFYARSQKLSIMEESVLQALCMGLGPDDIAQQHGVRVSTVRTQINHIRIKTGVPSVRALIARVAALPPMASPQLPHALQ